MTGHSCSALDVTNHVISQYDMKYQKANSLVAVSKDGSALVTGGVSWYLSLSVQVSESTHIFKHANSTSDNHSGLHLA